MQADTYLALGLVSEALNEMVDMFYGPYLIEDLQSMFEHRGKFQQDLGSAVKSVHLVSISIDPEQDTPARLRAYAAQYHAAHGWDHYSGPIASIIAVQKAFNAYRGDKMSHIPLTLMRAAPGKPWVRFDRFARAADLSAEHKSWESPAALR